jgi:hypothetical protein
VSGFWGGTLDSGCAHDDFLPAQNRTALPSLRLLARALPGFISPLITLPLIISPVMKLDAQWLSIGFISHSMVTSL